MGAGLAVLLPATYLAENWLWLEGTLGFFSLLLLVHGIRQYRNFGAPISLHADRLSCRNQIFLGKELQSLTLRHYHIGKRAQEGWFDLKLKFAGRNLVVQDTIDEFMILLQWSVETAIANQLTFSQATASNLSALGVELPTGALVE